MNQYSEKELDHKIQAFMARKTEQYPELMKTKKSRWTTVHAHLTSRRFTPSVQTLKPHLLG